MKILAKIFNLFNSPSNETTSSNKNSFKAFDPPFPEELIIEIFKYFSFEVLGKVALVSKKWAFLSSDSQLFLKFHGQLSQAILTNLTMPYTKLSYIMKGKINYLGKNYVISFDKDSLIKDSLIIEHFPKIERWNKGGDFQISEVWGKKKGKNLIATYFTASLKLTIMNESLNPEKKKVIQKSVQVINQRILQTQDLPKQKIKIK